MSDELWATYAVNDHLAPRSLAADILLFDRLVFPVPETPVYPDGAEYAPGPTDWVRNESEWARWQKEEWNPDAQHRVLDILKPVIRKQPWDARHTAEWSQEATRLKAQSVPDYAFVATRTVLTRDLPASVTGVGAMGPAYRTIEDAELNLGIKRAGGPSQLPGGVLAAVLGWEFLNPDDPTLSDEELLQATVDFVTGDADFQEARRDFTDWQQRFLKNGVTDRPSIKSAVDQMNELLQNQRRAAEKLGVRKVARYAFWIAPAAVGLGMMFAGVDSPAATNITAGLCSIGGIGVEELLFKKAEAQQPSPAAFVHHVNRHFGWT